MAKRPDLALQNSLRNLRIEFGDLMGLPVEERRLELLNRCQDVYDKAMERVGQSRGGNEWANPDCSAANKVIETVAKLSGVEGADTRGDAGADDDSAKPTVRAISEAAEKLELARRPKPAA